MDTLIGTKILPPAPPLTSVSWSNPVEDFLGPPSLTSNLVVTKSQQTKNGLLKRPAHVSALWGLPHGITLRGRVHPGVQGAAGQSVLISWKTKTLH